MRDSEDRRKLVVVIHGPLYLFRLKTGEGNLYLANESTSRLLTLWDTIFIYDGPTARRRSRLQKVWGGAGEEEETGSAGPQVSPTHVTEGKTSARRTRERTLCSSADTNPCLAHEPLPSTRPEKRNNFNSLTTSHSLSSVKVRFLLYRN